MYMNKKFAVFLHTAGTPTVFFILSALITLFLFMVGENEKGILFLISLIVVSGLAGLLKIIFRVARPIDAAFDLSSFAFPSGHSAGIAFLMAGILYLINGVAPYIFWAVALFLLILVSLIAISRVVLRVHTTFQVLVGLCIGFGVSLLIFINGDLILSVLENTL